MPQSGFTKFQVGQERSEKMDHIQDTARRVFGRIGFYKATVQDVISEAGISRRTFYSYFKSKEDVLARIIDRFADEVRRIKDLDRPEQLSTVDELRAQMIRLAGGLIPVIFENRDVLKLLYEGMVMDDQVLAPRSRAIHQTFKIFIRDYLEVALEKGLIQKCDPDIMSTMLLGMYMEVSRAYLVEDGAVAQDDLARELLLFLDRSLAIDPVT